MWNAGNKVRRARIDGNCRFYVPQAAQIQILCRYRQLIPSMLTISTSDNTVTSGLIIRTSLIHCPIRRIRTHHVVDSSPDEIRDPRRPVGRAAYQEFANILVDVVRTWFVFELPAAANVVLSERP